MAVSGLLILDKPYGMPSTKAVQGLKRRFRWSTLGHVGTLDPLATGVLPVCIGRATKLIPYLMEQRKRYEALIRLGVDTETQDREGDITRVYMGKRWPSFAEVEEALNHFTGRITQVPPMYSALKFKGRRLYEWARDGMEVPRASRTIHIYTISCKAYHYPFLGIDVTCGRGTYIRTLAADIGKSLGTGGHLWALKRLSVGRHQVEDALKWEQLMAMDGMSVERHLIPMGDMLSFLPAIKVSQKEREAMANGRPFALRSACPVDGATFVRIQDQNGVFLGLGGIMACNVGGQGVHICIRPSLVMIPS